jgi:hypothetical protein
MKEQREYLIPTVGDSEGLKDLSERQLQKEVFPVDESPRKTVSKTMGNNLKVISQAVNNRLIFYGEPTD